MDGDTVVVLSDGKPVRVRLAGIDAPEKKQPFGDVSKKSLAALAWGREVIIVTKKNDRYGRAVVRVMVCEDDPCQRTTDAKLAQIERGLAWHYKHYEKEQPVEEREAYARAKDEARATRLGMWSGVDPVAPWDWRKTRAH